MATEIVSFRIHNAIFNRYVNVYHMVYGKGGISTCLSQGLAIKSGSKQPWWILLDSTIFQTRPDQFIFVEHLYIPLKDIIQHLVTIQSQSTKFHHYSLYVIILLSGFSSHPQRNGAGTPKQAQVEQVDQANFSWILSQLISQSSWMVFT